MRALRQVDSFGSILKTYASGVGYSVAGQVTGLTVGNGLVEQYTYSSDRLQLTNQKVLNGATALMDFTYNYSGAAGDHGAGTTAGNAGHLIAMTGTLNGASRNQTFRYDDLGRLEKATGSDAAGAWQRRFVYDRWGNRTQVWNATAGGTQTQQVNLALIGSAPSNRVASYWDTVATGGLTKTVSYDAAGNTTNDGTYTFTYDAENRIAQVNSVATGSVVATYSYDSANRRIKKTVGTTTTCYIWEGAQVIAEYNNAAAPSSPNTEYIFTGGRMLAEERTGSGTTRFFHQDRLSTRLTTNSAGAVLGTQSHLPFGEQLSESSEQQKWKFTTYERDSETGDDYAINRGYWPTLGRFRQADPVVANIGIPLSLHRYSYVLGDPINLADPLGLDNINIGDVGTITITASSANAISAAGAALIGIIGRINVAQLLDGYDPRVDFRDYARQLLNDKSKSDCLKLALLAYKAGQVSGGDANRTVSTLLNGLTEFASIGRVSQPPSDPNFRVGTLPPQLGGFGETGFNGTYNGTGFRDGSNQVRHFVGFFAAAYQTDRAAARGMLLINEGTLNSSNKDVALGLAAINLGVRFNGDYRQLAQDIWHNICGQRSNLNLP